MEDRVHKALKSSIDDATRKMARAAMNKLENDLYEINDELNKIDDQVGSDQVTKIRNMNERTLKLNKLAIKASNRRCKITEFLVAVQKANLGDFKINAFENRSAHAMLVSLSKKLSKLKKIQAEIATYLYTEKPNDPTFQATPPQTVHKEPRIENNRTLENALMAHFEGLSPAARKKRAAEFYVDDE